MGYRDVEEEEISVEIYMGMREIRSSIDEYITRLPGFAERRRETQNGNKR